MITAAACRFCLAAKYRKHGITKVSLTSRETFVLSVSVLSGGRSAPFPFTQHRQNQRHILGNRCCAVDADQGTTKRLCRAFDFFNRAGGDKAIKSTFLLVHVAALAHAFSELVERTLSNTGAVGLLWAHTYKQPHRRRNRSDGLKLPFTLDRTKVFAFCISFHSFRQTSSWERDTL